MRWLTKAALNRFEHQMGLAPNSLSIMDVVLFPKRWQLFPDSPIKCLFSERKPVLSLAKARKSHMSLRARGISLVAFGIGQYMNQQCSPINDKEPQQYTPHIKLYVSDSPLDNVTKHNCCLLPDAMHQTPAQKFFIKLQSLICNTKPHGEHNRTPIDSVYHMINRHDGRRFYSIWQQLNYCKELFVINNQINIEDDINMVFVEVTFPEQSMIDRFNEMVDGIICEIECGDQNKENVHPLLPKQIKLTKSNKFTYKFECDTDDIVNCRFSFRKATAAELREPVRSTTTSSMTSRRGRMLTMPILPLHELSTRSGSGTGSETESNPEMNIDEEYKISAAVPQDIELHSARSHYSEVVAGYATYRGTIHWNEDREMVHKVLTDRPTVRRFDAVIRNASNSNLARKLEDILGSEAIRKVIESEGISPSEMNQISAVTATHFRALYTMFSIHANTSFLPGGMSQDFQGKPLPIHSFKMIWKKAKMFRFCWNFDSLEDLLEYTLKCREVHDSYMVYNANRLKRFKLSIKEYIVKNAARKHIDGVARVSVEFGFKPLIAQLMFVTFSDFYEFWLRAIIDNVKNSQFSAKRLRIQQVSPNNNASSRSEGQTENQLHAATKFPDRFAKEYQRLFDENLLRFVHNPMIQKFEFLREFRLTAIMKGQQDPFRLVYTDHLIQDRVADIFEHYAEDKSIESAMRMLQFKLFVDRWVVSVKRYGPMMMQTIYKKMTISFESIVSIFFISKHFGAYSVAEEDQMDFQEFFDAVIRVSMIFSNYSKNERHQNHAIALSELRELLKYALSAK